MITGQLIFREASKTPYIKFKPNTTLFMVIGVWSFPVGQEPRGEHQYIASGVALHDKWNFDIGGTPVDLTERIKGYALGQTLTEPLWRV